MALYRKGAKVELSRATPMLEDLGLRVIEEVPSRLEHHEELWVQAFSVLGAAATAPLDLERVRRPRRRVPGEPCGAVRSSRTRSTASSSEPG